MAVVAACVALGCGPGLQMETPITRDVVSGTALRVAPSSLVLHEGPHPWSDEGAATDCDMGVTADDDILRVESGICRYGVWSTTSGEALPASRLTFSWWHDSLFAAEGGEAHLAVAVADVVVADVTVPIPAVDDFAAVDVPAPAIAIFDVVSVHLHNHGANHWGLSALTFTPPPPGASP